MKTLLLAAFLYAQVTADTPGIVTGRILTADGLPAASVRVSVTPIPDSSTQNAPTPPLLNLVETDQSGNFRIADVIPGRYHVVAGFVEFPTFYPGVRERAAATIVNVTAGSIVSGINFQVAPISTGLKLSGRVLGLNSAGLVARSPVTVSLNAINIPAAAVSADGSFEFSRVPPGRYAVRVSSPLLNGESSSVTIDVGDKNLSGVEISVNRLKDVAGRVVIEGRGVMPRLVMPLGSGPDTFVPIEPQQDGTFRLKLPEGQRRVGSFTQLPAGYSVKSFTYGNVDLTRDPLRITMTDSSELRLTLSAPDNAPLRVKGRIAGFEALDSPRPVRVTLGTSSFFKMLTTSAAVDGSFEFPEVFPGTYTVRAEGSGLPNVSSAFIAVSDSDVNNVELTLPPRQEVRGRVVLESSGPMPRLALGWASGPAPGRKAKWIDPLPDGTFRVPLYEGEYYETQVSLPPGYKMTSFKYGATDLTQFPLKIAETGTAEVNVRIEMSQRMPVKVSGHARGAAAVTMKSSSYAAPLNAIVAADGSFQFPLVYPGNYALYATGPGIGPNTCAPVIVKDADHNAVDVTVQPPSGKVPDIQILSAVFGAAEGSADVTPIVGKWVRPELDGLYAVPKWLEVDPAVAQLKNLVISYLYQCKEHLISVNEAEAISYTILAEHADPRLRPLPASVTRPGADDLNIVVAYYGTGTQYNAVTAKARELLHTGSQEFIIDDAIFNTNVNNTFRQLIVTYLYKGNRYTFSSAKGAPVSYDMLIAHADSDDFDDRYSSEPPPWVQDAEPFSPRDPGDPGPGFGQSPRKELGIATMMKALMELKAIGERDRNRDMSAVISFIEQAIADVQASMNYKYPSPSSKPILPAVRPAPKSVRLANASKALRTALNQLSNANPNQQGVQFMTLALEELQAAVSGLQKIMISE